MPFTCTKLLSETDKESSTYQNLREMLISPSKTEVTENDTLLLDYMHELLGKVLVACINDTAKTQDFELTPLFYVPLLKCMTPDFTEQLCLTVKQNPEHARRLFAFFLQEHILVFRDLLYQVIRKTTNLTTNRALDMSTELIICMQSLFWTEDTLVNHRMHPCQRYVHVNLSAKKFLLSCNLAYYFKPDIQYMIEPWLKKGINTKTVYRCFAEALNSLGAHYIDKLYYHALMYPLNEDLFISLLQTTSGERFLKKALYAVATQALESKFDEVGIQSAIQAQVSALKRFDSIPEGVEKKSLVRLKSSAQEGTSSVESWLQQNSAPQQMFSHQSIVEENVCQQQVASSAP